MNTIHRKSALAAALAAALASATVVASPPLTGTATPAGQPVITVPPRPMAALQMQGNGAADSTRYATGIPGPTSTSTSIPLPAGGSGGSGGGTTCTAGTSTQSQTGACLAGQTVGGVSAGATTFPQTRLVTESCPSGPTGAPSYSYSGWAPTPASMCSTPATTCTAGTSTQSQTGACLAGQYTLSGGTTFAQTRTVTETCPSGPTGAPSYSYSGWTPTAASSCSTPVCTPNAVTSCNLSCGGGSFTYANGGTQTCNSTGTANSACTGTCPGPCVCQGPALCTGPNSPLTVFCGPGPGGTYPSTAACIDYGVAGQACNYVWQCGMGGHATCG